MSGVVIVSWARTPIGKLGGALARATAPQLGATAIRAALARAGVDGGLVDEVIMGNVLSAGMGQAPARQASMGAGIPVAARCTTVNKVCASGMKAISLAAQSIALGHADVAVAGGLESMSNVPYYAPSQRAGARLGHASLLDGVIHDGLWDPYDDKHMGLCAEACADEYAISREEQDAYALASYARALAAAEAGRFAAEIAPVEVPAGRGKTVAVSADEEPAPADAAKLGALRPAFRKDGSVTAANASKINDGAAAFVLMSERKAAELGATPIAKVRGYADAEQEPVKFTTAPALAVPVALRRAGVAPADVGCHEINEAFSVVALANMRILGLDHADVNTLGGAVALGHPIGMSGARIVGTLLTALDARDQAVGCASICNGGGGASALVLERV